MHTSDSKLMCLDMQLGQACPSSMMMRSDTWSALCLRVLTWPNAIMPELLLVICRLEEWRHILEGTKYMMKILNNHWNIMYFWMAQQMLVLSHLDACCFCVPNEYSCCAPYTLPITFHMPGHCASLVPCPNPLAEAQSTPNSGNPNSGLWIQTWTLGPDSVLNQCVTAMHYLCMPQLSWTSTSHMLVIYMCFAHITTWCTRSIL